MQPVPPPPWHKGPLGIYTINYPRPLFPIPKQAPKGMLVEGGEDARIEALSAISGLSLQELRRLVRTTIAVDYTKSMKSKGGV